MIGLLFRFLSAVWSALLHVFCCRARSKGDSIADNAAVREGKITVGIVGAGFGGLYLARELADDSRFSVVLIEPKTFAEYTPGVMKAVVTPEHLRALHASLSDAVPSSVRVIQGICEAVVDGGSNAQSAATTDGKPHAWVRLVGPKSSGLPLQRVDFDVCVFSTGSSYRRPYKADHETALDAEYRYRELLAAHDSLKESENAVVIGGGPVGVELAAEIVHKWPGKRLTVINFAPSLLFGMDPAIGQAAHAWLEERGVTILLNTSVEHEGDHEEAPEADEAPPSRKASLDGLLAPGSGRSVPPDGEGGSALRLRRKQATIGTTNGTSQDGKSNKRPLRLLITQTGQRILSDCVMHCAGVVPNTGFLFSDAASTMTSPSLRTSMVPPPPPPALPSAPRIATDRFLRVVPNSTPCSIASASNGSAAEPIRALFFAVGDAARTPYGEPALAHTAEKHAECVLRSLKKLATAIHVDVDGNHRTPLWRRVAEVAPSAMCSYPEALTGVASAPVIMDVSLGPYEAVLAFDCLSLTDRYVGRRAAAAMKLLLETTKVMQMRNQWLGKAFWHLSDEIALAAHAKVTAPLSRWLKEREQKRKQKAAAAQGLSISKQ